MDPVKDTRLRIECPYCKKRFRADRNLMGQTGPCPNCESLFAITPDRILPEEITAGELPAAPAPAEPTKPEPAEAKPAEAKPTEAKPAEAKPMEAGPTAAKPVDAGAAETGPTAAKPVDAGAAEASPRASRIPPGNNPHIPREGRGSSSSIRLLPLAAAALAIPLFIALGFWLHSLMIPSPPGNGSASAPPVQATPHGNGGGGPSASTPSTPSTPSPALPSPASPVLASVAPSASPAPSSTPDPSASVSAPPAPTQPPKTPAATEVPLPSAPPPPSPGASASPGHQSQFDALPWKLNFERFTGIIRGRPPWRSYSESWMAANDNTLSLLINKKESRAGAPALLLRPAAQWKDYLLETNFRLDAGTIAFLFRLEEQPSRGPLEHIYRCYALEITRDDTPSRQIRMPVARFQRLFIAIVDSDPPRISWSAEEGGGDEKDKKNENDMGRGVPLPVDNMRLWQISLGVEGTHMEAALGGKVFIKADDKKPSGPVSGGIGFAGLFAKEKKPQAIIQNLIVHPLGIISQTPQP